MSPESRPADWIASARRRSVRSMVPAGSGGTSADRALRCDALARDPPHRRDPVRLDGFGRLRLPRRRTGAPAGVDRVERDHARGRAEHLETIRPRSAERRLR